MHGIGIGGTRHRHHRKTQLQREPPREPAPIPTGRRFLCWKYCVCRFAMLHAAYGVQYRMIRGILSSQRHLSSNDSLQRRASGSQQKVRGGDCCAGIRARGRAQWTVDRLIVAFFCCHILHFVSFLQQGRIAVCEEVLFVLKTRLTQR